MREDWSCPSCQVAQIAQVCVKAIPIFGHPADSIGLNAEVKVPELLPLTILDAPSRVRAPPWSKDHEFTPDATVEQRIEGHFRVST